MGNEELLIRIAEALEGIRDELCSISSSLADSSVSLNSLDKTLAGCTCTNGKSNFLCVTGNISTN